MGSSSSHHKKHHQQTRVKKNVHWTPENAEPPASPGKPQLLPDSPHSDRDVFTIRWEPPEYDGGTPVLGYLVEHRRTGSPYWVRASPHMVEDTELMLSGLEPGWRYQFRITAENAVGFSEPGPLSEPLTVTYQRSPAAAPSFIRALHDTTALEDEKVEFTVQVEGIPTPKVSWYKDGFEMFSNRRQRIVTDNDISTLIIHQAALMDEGEIKCTATNRAGHAITKARLRLEAPPTIRLPKQYEDGLLFEMGEIIKLKVSVAGMPPPTARWLHNGEPLTSGGRYEITHSDKYLSLRINDARRGDRGEYQAHGVNSLGEDMASFLVTVTDRPLPPGKAKVVMTLGKSVTLSWSEPEDDGGCKIGNYIVEYFRIGWNMWLKAATCRQLTTTLGDLIEGSEYKFRVKAENPYGVSDPSEESDVVFIPDPKRGLLEPPVKGLSQLEGASGIENEMFQENWYDEKKIRGREMKLPQDTTPVKKKEKIWQGGDDSLSSNSSVFLSDSDLNKIRNTSSLENTPVVPKRKAKLSHKEFDKSGSLVSDCGDEVGGRRRRNTSLERRILDRDNSSLHSLDNARHYEQRMSLEKEKPLYGTDDSLYRMRNESLHRVKKSESPMRQRSETPKSGPGFDKHSSMSPPPSRRRKSKSRSPSEAHRSPSITRRHSNSSLTKEKKSVSKSPLNSPKALRDISKVSQPSTSGIQKYTPKHNNVQTSPPTNKTQHPARIAATSREYDDDTTTDLDEEELEAMAVKTVIQIKIKTDNPPEIKTSEVPQIKTDHVSEKDTAFTEKVRNQENAFKEDNSRLGLHNLSETERKKLSLGTQKSFEDKAERDLSDMLHGSSELMLLLLPNSSRENSEERELRKKEMKINLSIDNIMAPPVSLSAPEINEGSFYIDENYELPIREAFSSTELLHEKKMARLYQSLEEIEAENEEYKKRKLAETSKTLTRKLSLTDKRKILLERRRSSEAEESDSGRRYSGGQFEKMKRNKVVMFSEDEETEGMSDANNALSDDKTEGMRDTNNAVSDDNSRVDKREDKVKADLETHNHSDYDIAETNEQHTSPSHTVTTVSHDYDSDYFPEKTIDESLYGYDSDYLDQHYPPLDDRIEEEEDTISGVVKDDAYYENLGDVLTKKYSLPVNEIQITIDKPDDEPDYVVKGKYEVDNEMLLKRAKLKPQYSSEMSEASNITDDELDEEDEEENFDFDELFEETPDEELEEDQPINFARNRYNNRYLEEDEETQTYHPRTMNMKPMQYEDEPPPIPEHQEPEVPLRTSSIDRNRLSPQSMLKKQPVKPILKNKGKKVGKVLDVEIHIDNNEPSFDSIILNSPKTTRKKKKENVNQESSKKSKLSAILKPILKKEIVHVEKVNDNFKQFPVRSPGDVLLIPKSLQKVSDVESDTDTEKTRKKHVRITEPGTPDENELNKIAIINHYSDLVKEYGTKQKKSAPKMILTHDELKAKAIENEPSFDWDKVVEPSETYTAYPEPVSEMKDPFGEQRVEPVQDAFEAQKMREVPTSQRLQARLNNYLNKQGTKETSQPIQNGRSNTSQTKKIETSLQLNERQAHGSKENENKSQMTPYVPPGHASATQKRIHSYFDYTVDVFVFGIACWIYFFKHPILCVPILLLLICKQFYENRENFLFWKQYYKKYEQTPPE
uniref:Titin n=1 Tax=Cacopsylla melanoneura TaxID=428564 RepID=A0A8D9ERA3_9HEMI